MGLFSTARCSGRECQRDQCNTVLCDIEWNTYVNSFYNIHMSFFARYLFDWCKAEGLNCYIKSSKIECCVILFYIIVMATGVGCEIGKESL